MKITKIETIYEYDFEIIGIISPLKGYKLAWLISNSLNIKLKRNSDITIDFMNEGKIIIQNYNYTTEYTNFCLIKNKSIDFSNIASPYLMPELKDYDYLIQIKDEIESYDLYQIVDSLRELQGVDYISKLDTEKLKSLDNLIF